MEKEMGKIDSIHEGLSYHIRIPSGGKNPTKVYCEKIIESSKGHKLFVLRWWLRYRQRWHYEVLEDFVLKIYNDEED